MKSAELQQTEVLVVDDDPAILDALETALEQRGVRVTPAGSLTEAQQQIKLNTFNLVMTDLRLESEVDGLEVARAARARAPETHIVLFSGFDLSSIAEEASQAGVDEMLTKPFGTEVLDRLLTDLGIAEPVPPRGLGRKGRLSDPEGQQLLQQYVNGDHDVFNLIVEAYLPMIYSVFLRWFRLSQEDADDLLQEVLLQLVVKAETVRNVRMWLLGTAVNQAKKKIRHLIRDRRLVERYMQDLSVHSADDSHDMFELIALGFGELSSADARLLQLIYIEGLSYQEVADVLQRPIGSIGPQRGRALKRLTAAIARLDEPTSLYVN